MGSKDALSAWIEQERFLDGANRPLRLRFGSPSDELNGVLLPQKVSGGDAICGAIDYDVFGVSLSPKLKLTGFIGLPVAIELVTDRGELRNICGIVTEAVAGDFDGGLAAYKLRIRDAMSIMEMRIRTRVFKNMSELQIVQMLVGEWQQPGSVVAAAFRLEIAKGFHRISYPPREFTMQYNESDAAFIRRLLKRCGISWFFRADGDATPSHTLVLFNRSDELERNAADSVRYHLGGPTEQRDTVTAWNAVRSLQGGKVERFSWDYKFPYARRAMGVSVTSEMTQGAAGDSLAASLEDYQVVAPHIGDGGEDFFRLGHIQLQRKEFDAKCFVADCTVRTFCAGEYFSLTGHPEIDTHPLAERDFVITGFHIVARNNLPTALAMKVERLFTRSRWQASGAVDIAEDATSGPVRCEIQVTVVRRGVPIVPAFDPRTDVPQAQTQTAIVVGPAGEEICCDKMGRVLVLFPGAHSRTERQFLGGVPDEPYAYSAWVRVASNWAGNGPDSGRQFGTISLPRSGTEVVLTFLHGDPDKPLITGQVYNGDAEPPALSKKGALPANRYLSGMRSREKAGYRGNQLRFDDSAGRINAQLASDHAASQLNLGFLVHPLEGGHGENRGEGAELRSDASVAIRSGKGTLISAAASKEAEGAQLDCSELTETLDALHKLSKQLADLAKKHSKDEPGGTELADLLERTKKLAENGPAVVAVSAPAGLVAGSASSIGLGAASDIDMLSGGTTTMAAGAHLLLRAALDISLFANELGMKFIASKGPVRVQAQDDTVEILAKKVLDLISTTDWINIKAKTGVRIYGGGSELEISAAGIKGYTGGKHEMYAADHQTFPKQDRATQFPDEIPHHEICLPCVLKASKAHAPFVEVK